MLENLHQREQGGEAHFVILAGDALLQLREPHRAPAAANHLARDGHFDTQELVAFAILAGARLEKAGEAGHLGGVGAGCHFREQQIIHRRMQGDVK